jgi:pilus assembly protein CpaB
VSVRTIIVALLALICGGSAMIGVNALRQKEVAPVKPETAVVVMANADIPRGRTLTADILTTKDYPLDLIPPGAMKSVDEAVNRIVAIPMIKNEPILEAKLASKTAGRGISALIPDGMRACTIITNLSNSVAGLLLPGNRVDVLLSMTNGQPDDETGGASTRTLLQNVEVLAIGQHTDAPVDNKMDENVRSVTVLVTPDQAALLELGQTKGTLHLTLRNLKDTKETDPKTATISGIDGNTAKVWDKRIKGWIEALGQAGKAVKTSNVVPAEVSSALPGQTATAPAAIRTLRGTAEGSVLVDNPAPAEVNTNKQGEADPNKPK